MTSAYINRIATAVPPNNVHAGFVRLAETLLPEDRRQRTVFRRMAERSGIERRYSFLTPAPENDTPELDFRALPRRENSHTPAKAKGSRSLRRKR
jgi:hypothetical protein